MTPDHYQHVLFVGPDLRDGSASETFRRQLQELRGEQALDDIVDTTTGFDELWKTVANSLGRYAGKVLLVDLDPSADSAYLDWLRCELQRIATPLAGSGRLFVSGSLLGRRDLSAASACDAIDQTRDHLPCEGASEIPAKPNWSRIPAHRHHLFLCIGARCVRRGALPLWKRLRQQLNAAGRIDTVNGVLITRTYCQFPCNLGPVATVHPSGHWYSIVNEEDVDRLVREQLIDHQPATDVMIEHIYQIE